MPTLHAISHEHYAMHATQRFLTGQVYPMLMLSVPHAWGTLDRKSTLFKLIVKFFLKGIVFMFWHDIVYIELLYCVTNFEFVWTWNEVAVVENAKVSTVPHFRLHFKKLFVALARLAWPSHADAGSCPSPSKMSVYTCSSGHSE